MSKQSIPFQLKKSLGQHFLHDDQILQKIADSTGDLSRFGSVFEIGPGAGALTKLLLTQKHPAYYVVELDDRWAEYLPQQFPDLQQKVIHEDILRADLLPYFKEPVFWVGNFPYNISSQIVFRMIDYKAHVTELIGMFQKEMAVRIIAPPGSKDYGVISVLTQLYYSGAYLFDVPPSSFTPPPKVMSGVIHLTRKPAPEIPIDEKWVKTVVKTAFNMRRKTMRNSLSSLNIHPDIIADNEVFQMRPEQLSVSDFIALAKLIKPQHDLPTT